MKLCLILLIIAIWIYHFMVMGRLNQLERNNQKLKRRIKELEKGDEPTDAWDGGSLPILNEIKKLKQEN